MSDTNLMIIAATELQANIALAGPNIEDKVRAAMAGVQDHWILTDKDMQLKASIAAVIQYCANHDLIEEQARIEWELEIISVTFGLTRGKSLFDLDMEKYEPIGLMQIWREVVR